MQVLAMDLEIVRDVKPPYSFGRPYELGVGVAVTYSPEEGFRDWFGGGREPEWDRSDIVELFLYLQRFEVVTFNGIRFDYRVIDGYLDPAWRYVPAAGLPVDAAPPLRTQAALQGRSIDLLKDITEQNGGKRVSLDAVMRGTLGHSKSEDSSKIPAMWRKGSRLEVIGHCREHTQATYDVWAFGKEKGRVHSTYRDVTRSIVISEWRAR